MKNKKQQLGRALIKDRFLKQPNQFINDDGLFRNNFVTIVSEDTSSSITQQNDIEQFIHTAILSNRDFTALRNASIVSTDTEQKTEIDLEKFKDQLTIPKRPEWDSTTTKEELHEKEQLEFLEWRRSLVYLEEEKQLLLTPFERNLQVWRQLWRVVERSELLVEIVDARNPLFFRSVDLQKYVVRKSVHLLLVNKADLLSREQRLKWAQYFKKEGIDFLFFSAHMAKELLEQEELGVDQYGQQRVLEQVASLVVEDDTPKEARILNAGELLSTLKEKCPVSDKEKRTIGFVGYPNVGKSSTLNALIGSTKVAVGATPGKTKHFQTIHLEDIVLCDCPGLVFPSFASTKAEMVVCGVLPIDQLRDHIQPTELVCQRIPKWYLESVYGIVIKTRDVDGTLVDRQPTAEELLTTYANARGFKKSSQGNADEARAARYILKDYVNGKLLYVQPPPGIETKGWKESVYKDEEWVSRQVKKLTIHDILSKSESKTKNQEMGSFDQEFFKNEQISAKTKGGVFTRVKEFPYQDGYSGKVTDKGKDKKHKKEKRKKVHVNWTKVE